MGFVTLEISDTDHNEFEDPLYYDNSHRDHH